MKLFDTASVKEIDAYTITHEPISSIDLMERASERFVAALKRYYSSSNRFVIFAGPGNNGGDALAVARVLAGEGCEIAVYLLNPDGKQSVDCLENRERLKKMTGLFFEEVAGAFVPPVFQSGDVVIDGLFGSGLTRPLSGGFADVVKYINQHAPEIVSIDIPSGLFGENNLNNNSETIIRASRTFTFQFPKLAFFFSENAAYTGAFEVIDIGLHPDILSGKEADYFYTEQHEAACLLKRRTTFSHKGTYGHALLIAGQKGKIGAALLAGKSVLRSGAGLLTMRLPASAYSIVQAALPEAMNSYDENDEILTSLPDLTPYNAIAIGPGMGVSEQSAALLEALLTTAAVPLVIDADGLNLLAEHPNLLELLPKHTLLTPHPKEFDRLFGVHASAYERHQTALLVAKEKGVFVVLKGAYSGVYTPDGKCSFNSTGNSGMATGGSGDVLTGVLLGLLAQGYSPEEASLLGVYLHGLAGDIARDISSEEALIASDITESLGEAFSLLKKMRKFA